MSNVTNRDRRRFLAASLAIPAVGLSMIRAVRAQSDKTLLALGLLGDGQLPPLSGAIGWINSSPLSASSLRGKVVLVEFWTYTCINWLRQLPYVRAWHEKYARHGLVVIGVHTPEFEFEKNINNIRWAVASMNIKFPVAIDSDFAIWRAFRNHSWPALYFVDAKGNIRHTHAGEGEYERSEKVIQQLLLEAGAGGFDPGLAMVEGRGLEAGADWRTLRTPETYVGYGRTANFASSGPLQDKPRVYTAPKQLRLNYWALSGDWTVKEDLALLNKPAGRVSFRFHARDVHLVMGPAKQGATVRYRVYVDGRAPGEAHGGDTDAQGGGMVTEQRLYQLIRQPGAIAARTFEIEFLDAGVEAFSFTFG